MTHLWPPALNASAVRVARLSFDAAGNSEVYLLSGALEVSLHRRFLRRRRLRIYTVVHR